MRILVVNDPCQAYTSEFRRLGHESYSCDTRKLVVPCPDWHMKRPVFSIVNYTWDLVVAFPSCYYFSDYQFPDLFGYSPNEEYLQFSSVLNTSVSSFIIINPVGSFSKRFRSPDQIIYPYQFGHYFDIPLSIWVKNLPLIKPMFSSRPPSGSLNPAYSIQLEKLYSLLARSICSNLLVKPSYQFKLMEVI